MSYSMFFTTMMIATEIKKTLTSALICSQKSQDNTYIVLILFYLFTLLYFIYLILFFLFLQSIWLHTNRSLMHELEMKQ